MESVFETFDAGVLGTAIKIVEKKHLICCKKKQKAFPFPEPFITLIVTPTTRSFYGISPEIYLGRGYRVISNRRRME